MYLQKRLVQVPRCRCCGSIVSSKMFHYVPGGTWELPDWMKDSFFIYDSKGYSPIMMKAWCPKQNEYSFCVWWRMEDKEMGITASYWHKTVLGMWLKIHG